MPRVKRNFRNWVGYSIAAGGFLVCLGTAQPAAALSSGAAGLFVGSTLTANGLTFQVTTCLVHLGTASTVACPTGGSATYEMIQSAGAGSTIKIQGIDGGDIFSNISNAASGFYDLNVIFQVTAALGTTMVNNVAMTASSTLTNNGGGTATSALAMGESGTAPGFTPFTVNGYGLTSGSTAVNPIFPATTSFNVNKDLKITSNQVLGADTVSLHYVTQTFTPAPEPISAALVLSGLAGLAYVRRRKDTPRH
eukprot:TRINITY_DN40987_c0_g1_i1.p2 TRINITY_DN40987_c0_g1~~TRINITY_DN40987_c0_g1_i1.p2  ORF type:complete len:251 (-),score=32.50 TRINITY_DN40987_c0_g1_i1:126-878(-)